MFRPIDSGVSVIVPCHDSRATVAAALDSALAQSFDDLEIVAIDDGSSDGTTGILERYAERYPHRVRVLRSDHRGAYVARNLGVEAARGAFVAFLDSDDLWEPTKLERQVAVMRARPEILLCHTGGAVMSADGGIIRTFPAHPEYRGHCFLRMLVRNRIATSSVMMRRAFFRELGGFDEDFEARGDWELWTRVARHGEFAAIDDPLIRYRMHDGRMSTDIDRMRRHHMRVIEKHGERYRAQIRDLDRYLRESRFLAYMAYGSEYLQAGRPGEARDQALHAIREKPLEPRGWKLLARSLAPAQRPAATRGPEEAGGRAGSDRPAPSSPERR